MVAFVPIAQVNRGDLSDTPNSVALVVSGVYTATASVEFGVGGGVEAIEVSFNQTAGTGGQSITISIEAFDPGSGNWDTLLTGAALASATTDNKLFAVGHEVTPAANLAACHLVRRRMRVTATHADTKNITYSLTVHAV